MTAAVREAGGDCGAEIRPNSPDRGRAKGGGRHGGAPFRVMGRGDEGGLHGTIAAKGNLTSLGGNVRQEIPHDDLEQGKREPVDMAVPFAG